MTRAAAVALAGFLASGCISLRWEHDHRFEPIPDASAAQLEPGSSELDACLARFGAPLYVWELPHGSFALAYGWSDDRRLGGTISIPWTRAWSPSYSYEEIDASLDGLVLVFGADERLAIVRRGHLSELAAELRRRPADVEDLGDDSGRG